MEQPRIEALEIGERFRVPLPGVPRVPPDTLLETTVLGHGQASSRYPRPPATRYLEMACEIDNREGCFPFANWNPSWGGKSQSSAPGQRRKIIFPDKSRNRQAPPHPPIS